MSGASVQEDPLPLYEYRCRKCGAQIEKIQKFSAPPLGTCQACGGQLERLLSTSAIRFKGSGWYVTDYARKSSSAGSAGSENPAAGKTNGSSAGESKKPSEPAKSPAKSKSSPD
jgi:putative FmdB family regulatory protein